MANIRIPESATSLLAYCRSSNSDGPHVWETFADMVAFLAAYGFSKEVEPPETFRAAKSANPIELHIFRNRGLYSQLLMVAIAHTRNWMVARSPDEICTINERFAALGASDLGIHAGEHQSVQVRKRLLEVIDNCKESRSQDKHAFQPI
jgi:hypothetical protein